jgi:hypothetical protein
MVGRQLGLSYDIRLLLGTVEKGSVSRIEVEMGRRAAAAAAAALGIS